MSFACLGFRSFVFLCFCFIFFFLVAASAVAASAAAWGWGWCIKSEPMVFYKWSKCSVHLFTPVPAWFNGLWNQWWVPLSLSWSRWLKCYIGSRNRQNDHWDLRMTLSKMTTSPLATRSTWYTHVMPVLCIETGRFPALNKIDENNILQAISSDTDLF